MPSSLKLLCHEIRAEEKLNLQTEFQEIKDEAEIHVKYFLYIVKAKGADAGGQDTDTESWTVYSC